MQATKAQVQIGHLTIDGYLTDDGIFGMSMTQLGVLAGVAGDAQNAARTLIRKLKSKEALNQFPQGFETHPISCKNVKIKLVQLDSVIPVLIVCKTEQSHALLCALSAVSLQKLFSEAFGHKFDSEDMQRFLLSRNLGIQVRNALTDAIKSYMELNEVSDNYRRWIYSNVSDRLNDAMTGKKASAWCAELDCDANALRDRWNDQHLDRIKTIEGHAAKLISKGLEPKDALEDALAFHEFPVCLEPLKVEKYNTIKVREYRRAKSAVKAMGAA